MTYSKVSNVHIHNYLYLREGEVTIQDFRCNFDKIWCDKSDSVRHCMCSQVSHDGLHAVSYLFILYINNSKTF